MWATILLSLLGCYKQVKIQERLELDAGPNEMKSTAKRWRLKVELRPQKYVGDKLYIPRSTAKGIQDWLP